MARTTERIPRADSRRNAAALLEAAKTVFASEGIDASLEEVARSAGVGKGTLYRHFETREHLLAAVMADRWARLGDLAADLEAGLSRSPSKAKVVAALRTWVAAYVASAHDYPGSGSGIAARLAADSEPVTAACASMRGNLQRLIDRGDRVGAIRDDVDAQEVLILVSAVTGAARTSPGAQAATREERFVDVVLAGLSARRA
jgi:AcrR family transcriptional regulator